LREEVCSQNFVVVFVIKTHIYLHNSADTLWDEKVLQKCLSFFKVTQVVIFEVLSSSTKLHNKKDIIMESTIYIYIYIYIYMVDPIYIKIYIYIGYFTCLMMYIPKTSSGLEKEILCLVKTFW